MDNTEAIDMIVIELRSELHPPNSKIPPERLEREAREMWIFALHIFALRNDLLAGVFETNMLSSAYQIQMKAVKVGQQHANSECCTCTQHAHRLFLSRDLKEGCCRRWAGRQRRRS